MFQEIQVSRKWRWLLVFLLAGGALLFTGCRTLGFYRQALAGQWEIITHQQKIEALLAKPDTAPELRRQLVLLERLREFAERELHLPVNGHYRKYVDLHRPFVVWNVQAAPEFSLEARTWWYPFLGSLDYRGYFQEAQASKYARHLWEHGNDVYCGGVQAYSTLGWFKDPVLSTFLFLPDVELAELIFHELGHQVAFAHGDTDFNEAFATCVGQEGARRWLASRGDTNALQAYQVALQRDNQVVRLVLAARGRLEKLYGDQRDPDGKIRAKKKIKVGEAAALRQSKRAILEELKRDYRNLIAGWGEYRDYEAFFRVELNNAKLNSIANYYDLVPRFEALLAAHQGELPGFYAAIRSLAKLHKTERQEQLRVLP